MLETSARLLRLLSLLQSRRDWSGPELAERLGVTARTVRRDVERLRALGYPVHAAPGTAGGYRLGAGAALPPLLLDDEEAVAVALCLRTGAGGTVEGIEETSVRALAKLEQVLPSRLRHRVQSMQAVTVQQRRPGPTVNQQVLTVLGAACRDREQLRFDYRDHGGAASRRAVEPYRLVHHGRRWYLLAYDVERADWRTFRVDRIEPKSPSGPRFTPRELPDDAAAYVAEGVTSRAYRFQAVVVLHAPAEAIAQYAWAGFGTVTARDDSSCELRTGFESLDALAMYVGMLGVPFEVREPRELADHLRTVAARLTRAADATAAVSPADR
ncbi:helix-turn-helix transcriptional regulator [Actinacidiphila bryophytorum]|uniref:Predicted DNA-binding transcriptional regulator YafY, contains an HTH and WYL domains n=1 Tax=Actinacidiphila bryophytorum TaxID=1436133 RepID=A0A9W4ML60_9ACTN|nr:YafY family protein [Actinacidiphila bryophytorum]MBM9440799.1 YafY family transcriptional regulator [Actinacidiphila bryophytorum]MBN6546545.1 YafY family transcriptional regulator [Actinacidiphila bryophytorum]CAG7657364.1 Predicted DNA-binding transcriptional regulator YafY, contains an HTH and WYL domains [Actinacidiphila bryophytorum]